MTAQTVEAAVERLMKIAHECASPFANMANWHGLKAAITAELTGAQDAVVRNTEFSQFLSDVATAAGLLAYGKQDKGLSQRIANAAYRLRVTAPAQAELTGAQPSLEMARRVASEYGEKDSQIDSGNLYAAPQPPAKQEHSAGGECGGVKVPLTEAVQAVPGWQWVPICLTPFMRTVLLNADILPTAELYTMLLSAAPQSPAKQALLTVEHINKIGETLPHPPMHDHPSWGLGYRRDNAKEFTIPNLPCNLVPFARAIEAALGHSAGGEFGGVLLPKLQAAFRTTVTSVNKYRIVFDFGSLEALNAADDEWRAFVSTVRRLEANRRHSRQAGRD